MVQVLVAAPRDITAVLPGYVDTVTFETAETGEAVMARLAYRPPPDMVLLHTGLPGLSGPVGMKAVHERLDGRPLAALVSGAPLSLARRFLSAGASAVLPAAIAGDRDGLAAALALLAAGRSFVVFEPKGLVDPSHRDGLLSDRELQVLRGICDGLQNKEIAHAFQIQEVTVKMHVRAIIRKLSARNRTHAAMIARDLGII